MARGEYSLLHNTKICNYPLAEAQKITICNRAIFREPGWESIDAEKKPFVPKPQNKGGDVREDSIRRARQKALDIIMLNKFELFVTWTLNKEKIDRYDCAIISKKLKNKLHNMQKRYNASYIVIPEHHKDGAIHMHGLMSGNFDLVDSGKKTKRGQTVYNMPQWPYGFSTAVKLDGNTQAIARYIAKYITKDSRKIFGNFYYAGGPIIREPEAMLDDVDFESVDAKEYRIKSTNLAFKYLDIDLLCDAEEFENCFGVA